MDFVVHEDGFGFSSNWVSHKGGGSLGIVRISEVDIIPVSFEWVPFLIDLFIDVFVSGGVIISRESISWFSNFFMFNIVNRKSSIS